MGLFTKFTDTIFLKESTDLQKRYDALNDLIKKYPENKELKNEYYNVKKGLEGEKQIHYQLEKANIGMYVLHDINVEYENLKAQIDYIIVTRLCCYFVECKNLNGNITVDEKGDFIREYTYNGQKIKKGMYSPIRQAEEHAEVFKKIWNTNLSKNKLINNIIRHFSEKSYNQIHRTLVVFANEESIINTKYAPLDIKYRIVKADSLVREIKYDLDNSDKNSWSSDKQTERWARAFLSYNVEKDTDYYKYYEEKYNLSNIDTI